MPSAYVTTGIPSKRASKSMAGSYKAWAHNWGYSGLSHNKDIYSRPNTVRRTTTPKVDVKLAAFIAAVDRDNEARRIAQSINVVERYGN